MYFRGKSGVLCVALRIQAEAVCQFIRYQLIQVSYSPVSV